jgi:hypothetical protein
MRRWSAAGNEEDPHVIRGRAALVPVAPAQVVQRVLDGLAECLVHAIGEETVEAGAFVDFIEMRQRLAGADYLAGGVLHGRTVGII